MLTSRQITSISQSVDSDLPSTAEHSACPETAEQLRIDRFLRQHQAAHSDSPAAARAADIINALEPHCPLHLQPRRFSNAPFFAVAASLVLAALLTTLPSSAPETRTTAPIAERAGMKAGELVSSPFVAEARLLADDTSRAADAVFAYLPQLGK